MAKNIIRTVTNFRETQELHTDKKVFRVQAITGETEIFKIAPEKEDLMEQIIIFLRKLGLSYPLGLMPGGIADITGEEI